MINIYGLVLTLLVYFLAVKIKNIGVFSKLPTILTAGVVLIIMLKTSGYDYSSYNKSAGFITMLLGPATIALAFPLVKNIDILKTNKRAVWFGFLFATVVAILSTYALGWIFKIDYNVLVSLLPKSVTTPIAIEISKSVGGIPELTACVVIITGIVGGLSAHRLLKFLKIKHDVAIGLSVGASSHVLGTSRCIEKNKEQQAAVSTLALIIVGLFTALIIPIFLHFVIK